MVNGEAGQSYADVNCPTVKLTAIGACRGDYERLADSFPEACNLNQLESHKRYWKMSGRDYGFSPPAGASEADANRG